MVQLRQVPESLDAAVDQGPSVADEEVADLPWSFPAWGFDLAAFHRWLAFLVPEGRPFQVVHPEDLVVVPEVDQAEAVAAVAFPAAVKGLLVDLPGMDWQAELGIAVEFHPTAGLESGTRAAY